MNILVTGGTGFIGSHTVVALQESGHNVVIVDSLINSSESVVAALQSITGKKLHFYKLDVLDTKSLGSLMERHAIDAIIHFAALKAVGESQEQPIRYYQNNIGGLLSVLQAASENHIDNLIFSSSATVYGNSSALPFTEATLLGTASNPYGVSKQLGERIVIDASSATNMRSVILRYFNPVGAHPSGLIGELPVGTPNNLFPYITQTAAGLRKTLTVFGEDYDTPDGTAIRDYIHVVDLAHAHVQALTYCTTKLNQKKHYDIFNIGTGSGHSVKEVLDTFKRVNQIRVPHTFGPRRPGDLPSVYADASKAHNLLSWKATKTLEDAVRDSWRWQQKLSG